MLKKANILCVSDATDLIIYKLFSELSNRGYSSFVTYTTSEEKQNLEKENVIAIAFPKLSSKVSLKFILQLKKIIKEKEIELIYARTSSGLSNALLATIGTSVKVVAYRGTQAKIRRTDPTYYLGILNPGVNHVVCATRDIKQKLLKFYKEEELTYNPKPFKASWIKDAIQHSKKIDSIPDDAFIVICIAQTKNRPHKGLSTLIQGFHLINNSKIHLIHIGDYEESDKELAKSGNNYKNIHMLGSKNDAIHFLSHCHVCICPSTRDASPRSLREAMACGLACIVTDIPGARDLVVHQKTGLIIPPNSPASIANAIEQMAHKPEKTKEFGKNGKEFLRSEFSWEEYVTKFDQLFRNLLSN